MIDIGHEIVLETKLSKHMSTYRLAFVWVAETVLHFVIDPLFLATRHLQLKHGKAYYHCDLTKPCMDAQITKLREPTYRFSLGLL